MVCGLWCAAQRATKTTDDRDPRGASRMEAKEASKTIHFQSTFLFFLHLYIHTDPTSIYNLQQRLLHPHPHTPRPPPGAPTPTRPQRRLRLRLGHQRIAIQHPAQGPTVARPLAPGAPERDGQVRAVHVEERQPEVAVVRVLKNGRDDLGACCFNIDPV